eukprot:TRINITY_DN11013_c0_g1_i1.p1 TRINITY_DN11013_c0_g1~~TRINITY_DN11013_c0_g1_i1.p1  ORF type:complete len:286 (+),score=67.10 TRINITY_DN11013_c0_g1_i1:24-881(+)
MRAMSSLRVALCQLKVGEDKAANVANAVAHVKKAAAGGAKLVVLPECFNTPYGNKYFPTYAEEVPAGPTATAMAAAAKEAGVTLVAGSIPEREGDKLFNTSLTFGPDGGLLAKFRKVHLFKLNTEKLKFDESETLTAGDKLATFPIDDSGVTAGVGICFDIRFPELAAAYQQQGTSLLAYPGAFNMVTGPKHWHLAARSRAVDTQQFVVLCSPARDPESVSGYVAFGHSLVVNPWGEVIAEAQDGEEIVYADIDFAQVEDTRKQLPILAGRRPERFSLAFTAGQY